MGRTGKEIRTLESVLISEDKKKRSQKWVAGGSRTPPDIGCGEQRAHVCSCCARVWRAALSPSCWTAGIPFPGVRTPIPDVRAPHPWGQTLTCGLSSPLPWGQIPFPRSEPQFPMPDPPFPGVRSPFLGQNPNSCCQNPPSLGSDPLSGVRAPHPWG